MTIADAWAEYKAEFESQMRPGADRGMAEHVLRLSMLGFYAGVRCTVLRALDAAGAELVNDPEKGHGVMITSQGSHALLTSLIRDAAEASDIDSAVAACERCSAGPLN